MKMVETEPPLQTDDVPTSKFVERTTIARKTPIKGTRTPVRRGTQNSCVTMTKSLPTMTNDHPVPPRFRTYTEQEGTHYPNHNMTNQCSPSPPTFRTPRI